MKRYLSKIKNEEIRNMLELAIDNLPPYFYEIPASSSSKYHPSFALGRGGLYRHTIITTEIALESFNIMDNFDDLDKDIIITSLLLHDGLKQGLTGASGHSTKTHPIDMGKFLEELWKDFNNTYKGIIIKCIKSHMGKWDEKGLLPTPNTKLERFVHYCDYLSSRRNLWDKFKEINNETK